MNILQANDIIQFALRIEEDGEAFYRKTALATEDLAVRGLFNRLADGEIVHKDIFQDMLSQLKDYRPPETYPGEYLAYIRDYIDDKVVFTKDAREAQLSDVHDTLSALRFAMQRELDSILYYQETKPFIPERQHHVVDRIIEEERRHFSKLAEVQKQYR
jgi:rubrerythrin